MNVRRRSTTTTERTERSSPQGLGENPGVDLARPRGSILSPVII
jgi:hypothetical protein